MQQDKPDDFVLATGTTTSIRDFVTMTFKELGMDIDWQGAGLDEKGTDRATGRTIIEIDPLYFRPAEVDLLLGDSSKAREKLGWEPKYDLQALCREMVAYDLELAKKEKLLKENGYKIPMPLDI